MFHLPAETQAQTERRGRKGFAENAKVEQARNARIAGVAWALHLKNLFRDFCETFAHSAFRSPIPISLSRPVN